MPLASFEPRRYFQRLLDSVNRAYRVKPSLGGSVEPSLGGSVEPIFVGPHAGCALSISPHIAMLSLLDIATCNVGTG